MDKIVFLKLLPASFNPELAVHADRSRRNGPRLSALAAELLDSRTRERTAVIVKRTADDLLSIQGYAPVPYRDRQRCCSLFWVRASAPLQALHTGL